MKAQAGKCRHLPRLEPAGPLVAFILSVVICQLQPLEQPGGAGDAGAASPCGESPGWARREGAGCVWVEGLWPSLPAAPPSCPQGCRQRCCHTNAPGALCQRSGTQRQGSQWKREALSTKQICWGCCSPSVPPSFIKLGPPANIFPPPANEHEVFPSLRLEGPLAAGSGELSAWAGRGAAPGGCRVGRGNPPTCSHREKDPSLSLEQPFRIATCQQPQR